MKHKNLIKDMLVVWISTTALVCAALNMHINRNMLESDEASVEGSGIDEETEI